MVVLSKKYARKILFLLVFLAVILTVTIVDAKCSGKGSCKQDISNTLSRYNRFVRMITGHHRSVPSRRTHHVRTTSRKRSTVPAKSIYEGTQRIRYNSPVQVLPSNSLKINSAYTTVHRNMASEGRNAILRQQHIRLVHARQKVILDLLRRKVQKPWWGTWSSWSACGRTCGSGVQFQERNCLGSRWVSIHRNGKLLCKGSTKRYKICNSVPCPEHAPSFRKLQCSQHAANQVRGRFYSWKPYGHPVEEVLSSEPCQLVCVSNVDEIQINNVAMDGTECHKGWNDGRCVDGKCQLIGCDGKINSEKLRNKCGKCDQDATSCEVHDQVFSQDLPSAGEYEIVRIPEGAYDILINERRKTSASILVKDTNGTILFNGGGESTSGLGAEGWPSNVMIAGGEFRYRKPIVASSSVGFEYLVSSGPIFGDVIVYLNATREGNSLLHYEFKIPVTKVQKTVSTSENLTVITSISNPNLDETFLSEPSNIFVPGLATPSKKIPTERIPLKVVVLTEHEANDNVLVSIPPVLEYEYIGEDEHPEEKYEEGFLVLRELDNVPIGRINNDENESPSSINSLSVTSKKNQSVFVKPQLQFQTETDDEFVTGSDAIKNGNEFVRVAIDNNTDIKTIARVYTVERELPGENEKNNNTETDSDVVDDDEKLPDYEDYEIAPGVDIPIAVRYGNRYGQRYGSRSWADFTWRTNGFAPCSSTCRSGLQDSYAVCKRISDHLTVDDSYCDPTTRPEPVRRSCFNETCQPRWEATPWSDCSLSCGTGVQMRTVRCWQMIGPGFDSTLYTEICDDVAGEKLAETKPCKIVGHCGPLWESSDWSACSAPCGRVGFKWRTVRCSAGQDNFCVSTPRPNTKEQCMGPKCLLHWIATEWGPCSGVCGGGRKVRRVICADNAGRGHPEHRCDLGKKPTTSHPCGDVNCRPEWISQEWEECSVECGSGVRTRTVMCSGIVNGEVHHYEDDSPCSAEEKPATQEECQMPDCDPVWFTTSWSKCSVTCKNGNRVREVKCYLKSAPATGCDETQKPPQRESCDMPTCPAPKAEQCKNKLSVNCILVLRVKLCSHWYYRKACCISCKVPKVIHGK